MNKLNWYEWLESHIVETTVDTTDSFDGVEPVKFKGSSVKGSAKVAVAGEIFFLNLKISWFAATIVHVVCVVDWISNFQSVLWVLRIPLTYMELCCLLELAVFGVWVNAFPLKGLPYYFALDKTLSSTKILKRVDYL